MSQEQLRVLQQLLRSAHQVVVHAIEGITEKDARQVPAPDEWTVAQLLAHIAEIQDFWMGKAVLITKEVDPNITRSDVENDRRAAAVTDHASDPITVEGVIHYLASHMEEHAGQITMSRRLIREHGSQA